MPDTYQPLAETKFIENNWNGKHKVLVPDYGDGRDWWKEWERERTDSMEKHLKPGMLLFEIGGYDGWQDVVLSRFIGGPQNLVIVEPVPENWALIRATFEANGLGAPHAAFMGFCDDDWSAILNPGTAQVVWEDKWPPDVDYSKLIQQTKFKLIHEHKDNTSEITLDVLAAIAGVPHAINIDVEGAELHVLRGAIKTLMAHHPMVWVSIHPKFIAKNYGYDPIDIFRFMTAHGYPQPEFLAWDHEMHWLWKV
jgi:FkbM family methyltransferase